MENKTITRGDINFHLIDCIEFMKSKPDNYYDLAIVDPPYGINIGKMAYLTENKTTVKQKNGTKLKPAHLRSYFCNLSPCCVHGIKHEKSIIITI